MSIDAILEAAAVEPFWRNAEVAILRADCRDILPRLPDGCVDAVVTDPPYGVDYAPWDSAAPPQALVSELLRVSAGPVLMFGAAPVDCVRAACAYDPPPDRMLVWAPVLTLSRTASTGTFFRFHPIWLWRPPEKAAGMPWDVLRERTEAGNWWTHPATKPLALMERLVGALSPKGGTVLDPFGGSGTTVKACVRRRLSCIMLELDEVWCDVARRRLVPREAYRAARVRSVGGCGCLGR